MMYDDLFNRYLTPLRPIPTGLSPGGRTRGTIRAVLFDLYGTLFVSGSGGIGSAEISSETIKRIGDLLGSHHLPYSPEILIDSYSKAILSEHARKKESGIDFPEVEIDRLWSEILRFDDMEKVRRFALAFELIINPVQPMPGASEMLSTCARGGLVLGIISNAQFYTPLLFKRFFGAYPEDIGFEPGLIIYSHRYGRAKPSPVLYAAATERLKTLSIQPSSVIFIGNDMLNDIHSARNSGFQTALFAGDRRSLRLRTDDPCCRGFDSDIRVTDFKQLPGMIGIDSDY